MTDDETVRRPGAAGALTRSPQEAALPPGPAPAGTLRLWPAAAALLLAMLALALTGPGRHRSSGPPAPPGSARPSATPVLPPPQLARQPGSR